MSKLPRLIAIDMSQWSPRALPSRGGNVAVYVYDVNQPSLPTALYSVFVSVSVFLALSPVFHFINCPGYSPLSHSLLPVLFLPYWSLNYISLYLPPVLPLVFPKVSEVVFLRLYFLQTRYIFPTVPTEDENSTARKSIQFALISCLMYMYWIR